MKITILQHALTVTALCALAGCGGDGSSDSTGETITARSAGLLKPAATGEEMATSLRRAIADTSYIGNTGELFLAPGEPGGELVASPSVPDSAVADFSSTNLQEAGVDEADSVKYDGEILYVLDYATAQSGNPMGLSLLPEASSAIVRLLRTDTGTPSAEEVSRLELGNTSLDRGLYLVQREQQKQLVSVGHDGYSGGWGLFAVDYYWQNLNTEVQSWDVTTPEAPQPGWSLTIEGSLLASRRIDDILYLVTRYTPEIEGLTPWPESAEEIAANQARVDATPVAELLPDITRDGGSSAELLDPTDCLLPNPDYEGLVAPPASGSLITVTAIDLTTPERMQSLCLNTFASGFYVSRDSLYLTASADGDRTYIHKVSLADGDPSYRGSGQVRGYLGTSNPSYMMSEHNGDLRVVSSSWEDRFFPLPVALTDEDSDTAEQAEEDFGRHFLTVLRESPAETALEEIARLPNAAQPAPIGKPGEDLFSARFLGDRAYLVTFELIDPLYVLDLADAANPRIAGELEIPGFSTVLQPLGAQLLLGVGSDVEDNGDGPLAQGVKVALFNVSDIENPVELASAVIGRRGSHSPAQHDYHALTLLETENSYRVALPVARHDEQLPGPTEPWTYYDWSENALFEFEVTPATGTLTLVGKLISEQRSPEMPHSEFGLYNSRSVLHDNAVFFIAPPQVLAEHWGE